MGASPTNPMTNSFVARGHSTYLVRLNTNATLTARSSRTWAREGVANSGAKLRAQAHAASAGSFTVGSPRGGGSAMTRHPNYVAQTVWQIRSWLAPFAANG